MKKFLSFIHWRHLKHLYHTRAKHTSHYRVVLEKFFQSKNGRLVAIILIAAAIPLTVIGAQQVQNLQQQAKETNECTDASYPLQVFPNPAEDGKEITFKLAEGTITEEAFQNDHFTGNGAVGCQLSGGVIKCKARFNSRTKTKPQSDHTYEVHGNKCNYSVKNPDANKPTKPPKTVTNTPKPTRDPNKPTKEPTTGKCELTLSPYNCTADNKPRMRATWDMAEEGECKVTLDGKEFSKECANSSENLIKIDGKDLESGKQYKIAISNGKGCQKEETETAPDCKSGGTTPPPGGGTNPPPSGENGCKGSIKPICGSGNKPALELSWEISGDDDDCEVYLSGSKGYTDKLGKCKGKTTVTQYKPSDASKTAEDIKPNGAYELFLKNEKLTGACKNGVKTENTRVPENVCSGGGSGQCSISAEVACDDKKSTRSTIAVKVKGATKTCKIKSNTINFNKNFETDSFCKGDGDAGKTTIPSEYVGAKLKKGDKVTIELESNNGCKASTEVQYNCNEVDIPDPTKVPPGASAASNGGLRAVGATWWLPF